MTTLYVLTSLIVAFFFFLYRKRKAYYPHNPHSDYNYGLPLTETIDIKNGTIALPGYLDDSYTIFARIRLSASPLGYLLHPSLIIKTERGTFRQYTEYGSRGYRYINLSNICSKNNRLIQLKGKRLRLKHEKVEVSAFRNPDLKEKKILVVAPHPDDAEIAAYGLYEKYAENVFIMTVSPGENGYFHYKELYTKNERTEQHLKKGQLRTWNSLTVPLIAGVKPNRLICFGYFNETLEEMYRHPEKEIPSKKFQTTNVQMFRKQNTNPLAQKLKEGSNWKSLVENVRIIIDEFRPDIIVSPHPRIDSHEDHQYSTVAVVEALKKMNYSKGSFFLYTNHLHYYPYGRMGSIMSLPPKCKHGFYFNSLFSFPLTQAQQRNKILAFDAMNDLRYNTDYRSWKRLFARGFTALRARCFSIEKDYFNTYIRSNELFYAVPFSEAIANNCLSSPQSP